MIAQKMIKYVEGSSVTRAMFEEGKKMAAQYGAENVYDFSLGNPSVEPPAAVKNAICEILEQESPCYVHGYMNNSGYETVREAIASSLNKRFGTSFGEKNILMTVGAAGGLNVVLKTLHLSDTKRGHTDRLKNYRSLIVTKIHRTSLYGTNHIEQHNLTIRTHLKRLTRKTIYFSRNAVILSAILKIYFWR